MHANSVEKLQTKYTGAGLSFFELTVYCISNVFNIVKGELNKHFVIQSFMELLFNCSCL